MNKFLMLSSFLLAYCNFFVAAYVVDVVIPCHIKDSMVLDRSIEGIKNNISGIGRIIVVSAKKLTNKAEWFDERWYPFSKCDVLRAMVNNNGGFFRKYAYNLEKCRVGWIYQQLLKFYAPFVIPGIADNILVIDADTVFLNPVSFFDDEGNALYAYRNLRFIEYKEHAKRLVPSIIDHHPDIEGIAHHMLLQRPVLRDLFIEVFQVHHKEFWQAFCNELDQNVVRKGRRVRASEYELYFSYIFSVPGRYKVKVRKLIGADVGSMKFFEPCRAQGYSFVSYQHYLRRRPTIQTSIP